LPEAAAVAAIFLEVAEQVELYTKQRLLLVPELLIQ
jgi:hypothetical protein